jgi:hypothetical protein
MIEARYRSHPTPPFETYTLSRSQFTAAGSLDFTNSYVKHVWLRTSDRAALTRMTRGAGEIGSLSFDRPAFNEPRDPGPPTADMFPAGTADYRVDSLAVEGEQLHLRLMPLREPDRNRLREIFADRTTYELRKLVATDRLFIDRGPTYPVTFMLTLSMVQDTPVVAALHGTVGGNYNDDGKEVDYAFTDIAFPPTLPDWYFDPATYGKHGRDAPN